MSQTVSSHPPYNMVSTLLLYTLFSVPFMVSSHTLALLSDKTNILPYSTCIQILPLHYISETILSLTHILSYSILFMQNISQNIPHLLHTVVSLLYCTCMHLNLFLFLLLLLFITLYYIRNLMHPTSIIYLFFLVVHPSFIFFIIFIQNNK